MSKSKKNQSIINTEEEKRPHTTSVITSQDSVAVEQLNQDYLIPLEVTPDTIRDFGIKKKDVVPAKIGNKIVSAIMVPATKEQYYAYMRPLWAEMKREERTRRCMVSNSKGKLKRCDDDCKKCDRMKEGAALSLDAFFEETKLEFEEPSANQCDAVLTAIIFEDLLEKLKQQAPDLAPLFEMLYDGKSQHEIGKLIGMRQSTVNYKVKRLRQILQQHVDKEDI